MTLWSGRPASGGPAPVDVVAIGVLHLPGRINSLELPGRLKGQVQIAEHQGPRFEPGVDPIHDQLGQLIVLGAATPNVQVGQDDATGEADVNPRGSKDAGKVAEAAVVSRWPGSGMGLVHPVKAEDLSAGKALGEMRVRPPCAEPELDDDPLLADQPPGGEIDAITLGDLLVNVGVQSAHALAQADSDRDGSVFPDHSAAPRPVAGDDGAEINSITGQGHR